MAVLPPLRLREALALALYRLAVWAMQPLLRRKLARRARQEPGYAIDLPARWGHPPTQPHSEPGAQPLAPAPLLWVHAVSLGETRAAGVLLKSLRPALPGWRLLLTHSTATGREAGQALLQTGDVQTWLPWDTRASVGRFLAHHRPSLGLLMETEVWPELSRACCAAGVPLALVNARLNDRSARAVARLSWLARPAYRALAAVWAQSDADARRLREIGAPVQAVVGNLKFDATPSQALVARAQAWRRGLKRPVVLLASAREGEEASLLQALAAAGPLSTQSAAQAVHWLIVPRHPQRFEAVAHAIEAAGWRCHRRSNWGADGPGDALAMAADSRPVLWLGDSLGEMPLYYGLADVALLGGSFGPFGGQNLIEAAACGCPLVLGPHTHNFAEAAEQALAAGAAQRVADLPAAVVAALAWCGDDRPRRDEAAEAALAFAAAHRGAAQRTVEGVLALLAPVGKV